MKVNDVLSLTGERFKELDFDSMAIQMKASLQEMTQRLNAICDAEDQVWKDLKARESRWLGLAAGLRKYLASLLHGSSVFLENDFEAFRALLFVQATDCSHREAADLLIVLRDRVLEAAMNSIGVHEKVLTACATCVRGEFGEVSLVCSEQKACWELVGLDEVECLKRSSPLWKRDGSDSVFIRKQNNTEPSQGSGDPCDLPTLYYIGFGL